MVGNCGFSIAPALPGKSAMLKEYLSASATWLPISDKGFREYIDTYPATSVNVVHQVGHNTLRLMTMGMEGRAATASELQQMSALLEDALNAGALGLSSGLFTAPGTYADREEIHTLARILKRHGARYSTHIRDEAYGVFDAVREAIDVARETGVHVQIAHLKLSGMDNWGGASRLIEEIAAARAQGIPVDCDQYPYDAGTNPLRNLLPSWLQEGGIAAMLARLKESDVRQRMRDDIAAHGLNNFGKIPSWDAVRVAISTEQPELAGRNLGEVARERRQDPFDAVCDCLLKDRGHTRIIVTAMAQEDVDAIASTPWMLVGSDGNSLATYGVTSQGRPHPRFYGTFSRLLKRYTRDLSRLTLAQAIHKMTGGSAKALGWTDRGWVRAGCAADVVVFDPTAVADVATYEAPHQYSAGTVAVLVNGDVVIDQGEHTGALPGHVIRRDPQRPGLTLN